MTLEETLEYVNNKDNSIAKLTTLTQETIKTVIDNYSLTNIVYLWINTKTNKFYVGSTENPHKRFCNFITLNKRYAGEKINTARVNSSIEDWNYIILEKVDTTLYTLLERETYYIRKLNAIEYGYNISEGAGGKRKGAGKTKYRANTESRKRTN